MGASLCSLIPVFVQIPPPTYILKNKKKGRERGREIMTSEAGLLLFKIRSNCFPALLGRQALSSPAQGLALYFPVAPTSLPFLSRHIPCDPSPGHYPALGWGGNEKLTPSLPLDTYLRSFDLPGAGRRGFRRMTSDPSLCPAHGHPHQAEAAEVGNPLPGRWLPVLC